MTLVRRGGGLPLRWSAVPITSPPGYPARRASIQGAASWPSYAQGRGGLSLVGDRHGIEVSGVVPPRRRIVVSCFGAMVTEDLTAASPDLGVCIHRAFLVVSLLNMRHKRVYASEGAFGHRAVGACPTWGYARAVLAEVLCRKSAAPARQPALSRRFESAAYCAAACALPV